MGVYLNSSIDGFCSQATKLGFSCESSSVAVLASTVAVIALTALVFCNRQALPIQSLEKKISPPVETDAISRAITFFNEGNPVLALAVVTPKLDKTPSAGVANYLWNQFAALVGWVYPITSQQKASSLTSRIVNSLEQYQGGSTDALKSTALRIVQAASQELRKTETVELLKTTCSSLLQTLDESHPFYYPSKEFSSFSNTFYMFSVQGQPQDWKSAMAQLREFVDELIKLEPEAERGVIATQTLKKEAEGLYDQALQLYREAGPPQMNKYLLERRNEKIKEGKGKYAQAKDLVERAIIGIKTLPNKDQAELLGLEALLDETKSILAPLKHPHQTERMQIRLEEALVDRIYKKADFLIKAQFFRERISLTDENKASLKVGEQFVTEALQISTFSDWAKDRLYALRAILAGYNQSSTCEQAKKDLLKALENSPPSDLKRGLERALVVRIIDQGMERFKLIQGLVQEMKELKEGGVLDSHRARYKDEMKPKIQEYKKDIREIFQDKRVNAALAGDESYGQRLHGEVVRLENCVIRSDPFTPFWTD